MVKAAPPAALIMSEPDFLLELLVVAFDAPAQLGVIDQTIKGDVLRQVLEPVAGRLVRALPPLGQLSHVRTRLVAPGLVTGGPHPHACQAPAQPIGASFFPPHPAPRLFPR